MKKILYSGRYLGIHYDPHNRRSSMYIPGKPPPPVRRAPSAIDNISSTGDSDEELEVEYTSSGSVTQQMMYHSMIEGGIMLKRDFGGGHALTQKLDGMPSADDFILPPSPFRSPDFLDDLADAPGGGCCDGRPGASNGRAVDDSHMVARDTRYRRASGGGIIWQPASGLQPATVPSPDDITPTNENQPQNFPTSAPQNKTADRQQNVTYSEKDVSSRTTGTCEIVSETSKDGYGIHYTQL